MANALRHHPRLRIVQADLTDALGDHPDTRRTLRAQRWLYRLGALAVSMAVLGAGVAVIAAAVALGRLVGGGK